MSNTDDKFFERADAHINLSNDQLADANKGQVSASMMYSTARFNAWVSATGFDNADEMENAKAETIKYFVSEYEKMLAENMDNYIANFKSYVK